VFIDIGENLSGNDAPLLPIDGLTSGEGAGSSLFLTHYHTDHIGLLGDALPSIPVYMGVTAKEILINLVKRLQNGKTDIYKGIRTFKALDKIRIGNIEITPLMIDHSAFDAYMFIIEADGKRILHTGDFRLHGVRGNKTLKMLESYARNIDYIICEGTMLSRYGEEPPTEFELKQKASELMKKTPYIFVLCSSTNIDRIGIFYHANPRGRLFVCDEYQKIQLEAVREACGEKSKFYNFRYVMDYGPNLDGIMKEKGFCMLVRQGDFFKRIMDKYKDNSLLIYSMWTGYLDERAKNQTLFDFISSYQYKTLHTSGHASAADLKSLYDTIKPSGGLIPIHSDRPEAFREMIPEGKLILLDDGEPFILK